MAEFTGERYVPPARFLDPDGKTMGTKQVRIADYLIPEVITYAIWLHEQKLIKGVVPTGQTSDRRNKKKA